MAVQIITHRYKEGTEIKVEGTSLFSEWALLESVRDHLFERLEQMEPVSLPLGDRDIYEHLYELLEQMGNAMDDLENAIELGDSECEFFYRHEETTP